MKLKRSKLTSDGDKDQETLNSPEKETVNHLMLLSQNDDEDHLPLIKRKIKIRIDTKRREQALKRPMLFFSNADPIPASVPIFDSESQSDSDDDDGNQERILKPIIAAEIHEELAQEIPEEYKKLMIFMGGLSSSSPKLVAERRLTKGDVDERRNRLLIPQRKIRANFLAVEEEDNLNREKWWPVEIIEPDCTVSLVSLSKWETEKGPAYVFITEWIGLVERNELQEGDLMQLWSFRAAGGRGRHGRLCFMLLEIGE